MFWKKITQMLLKNVIVNEKNKKKVKGGKKNNSEPRFMKGSGKGEKYKYSELFPQKYSAIFPDISFFPLFRTFS